MEPRSPWSPSSRSGSPRAFATTNNPPPERPPPPASTPTGDEETFAFGGPAEASEADRVVEIEMNDQLVFVPDEVEVTPGETITFRVHNVGNLAHDFTLGDEAVQAEHDEEMAEMAGEMAEHDEGNAIEVAAGETGEMTWHFTHVEGVLYGCHVPGHYAAGMRGTLVPAG
ncbi:MAG: plastocyanin/azurin family copper-binding protein [Actinomycetota bacterium]|nr:plastocyanin/azurin family copper-binding protein [Actinomycetota bacterium]